MGGLLLCTDASWPWEHQTGMRQAARIGRLGETQTSAPFCQLRR